MAKTTIKNSTLFYHDWLKAFSKMSDEDVGKICKALLLLDSEGVSTSFEDNAILDIVFSQFAATVERNREKYEKSCERKSEAAKRREAQKAQLCTTDHNCDDRIRKDSDSDSDSDTDKDSDKRRVVSGGEWSGKDTPAPAADTTTTTADQEIVRVWNDQTFTRVIRGIDTSDERRERTEMAVAVAGGLDPFLDAIRSINDQSYFQERYKAGMQVNYDWFIRPNIFQKVIEGEYKEPHSRFGDGWEVVEYDQAGG